MALVGKYMELRMIIQGGVVMTVPSETVNKMQSLTTEKMAFIINLVDQFSMSEPADIFDALCEDGAKNPMSEEEVDEFVSSVRKERNAVSD